jgi:hypothetical protein
MVILFRVKVSGHDALDDSGVFAGGMPFIQPSQ